MKVLVITNNINNKSGWGRYSSSIINLYPKFDLDYKIVSEAQNKEQDNELNILSPASSLLKFISNIIKVRKIAKNFDIIHAFDGWPYSIYGYFSVLGTRKKLFVNGIGTYSVDPFNIKIKAMLLRKAYHKAKQIFCISNYTKKKILEKIKLDHISTVLLGTPDLQPLSDTAIDNYKIKYNISNQHPIFLSVGAIKGRKGQYHSLRAISKLKSKYPNFKYFIIGSDKDKAYIKLIKDFVAKNNITNNVEIISSADDKSLAFFYHISDIFLLCSTNKDDYFEGFGLVLLEAAQFGLPVIGSKDCGIEDAVEDGYNGFLARQRDVDDIYNKIEKILLNKQTLSNNSKEFAKRFSWHKTVSKYYEYYNN